MEKIWGGIIVIIIGVLSCIIVYSMRPPEGIGEAWNMMFSGRAKYIKKPTYEVLMGLGIVVTIIGGGLIIAGAVSVTGNENSYSGEEPKERPLLTETSSNPKINPIQIETEEEKHLKTATIVPTSSPPQNDSQPDQRKTLTFCPYCGTKIASPSMKFCGNCGEKLYG